MREATSFFMPIRKNRATACGKGPPPKKESANQTLIISTTEAAANPDGNSYRPYRAIYCR